MKSWERIITQVRLGEEPYPRAKIFCKECEHSWHDDDDEMCICEEEEEESEDELQRIEWERIKRR